jgi:hypothetical protein
MLRAYLRNRVGELSWELARGGRLSGNDLLAWREALLVDEDSLTASVMERVAYLAPGVAWKLLSVACEARTTGDVFPGLPLREPTWHFWPKWPAAAEDSARGSVVPDVALEFPDLAVIFQARLQGEHRPESWGALVRAARQGPLRGRRLLLVALGGAPFTISDSFDALPRRGPDAVPVFQLQWSRVPAALEVLRRSGHLHQGQLEVLRDIEAVLADRGFRARTFLGSLPAVNGVRRQPWKSIAAWKPAVPRRPRPLGFAHFEAQSFPEPPFSLPFWRRTS